MTDNTQWNLVSKTANPFEDKIYEVANCTIADCKDSPIVGATAKSLTRKDGAKYFYGAWREYNDASKLQPGDYVVSVYMKASVDTYFSIGARTVGGDSTESKYTTYAITTEWQRYEMPFTREALYTKKSLSVAFRSVDKKTDTSAIIYIAAPKVEPGSVATPWCGTFEEEREKAIAARGGTYSSRLTLTALRATINYTSSGEKFYIPNFAIEKTNVPYINLQWNRALYEAGTFEVQLGADDYSSTYSAFTVTSPNESYGGAQAGSYSCDNYPDTPAYGDETRHGRICTATGHYEVGLVLKTRFVTKSGRRYVLLSGLMLDSMLDGWSTHTSVRGTQSVQTALYQATQIYTTMGIPSIPTYQWLYVKLALATADDKALAPTIEAKDYDPSFSIVNLGDHFRTLLENRNLGLAATCLWNKLKDSSSVFMNCVFFVKAGVDRTLQSDNPVLIGCAFGNVASEEVTIDDSSLRDGITGYATYQPDSKNLHALWASKNKDMGGLLGAHWTRGYLTETNSFTAQNATTEDDARTAAQAYGANTLQDYIEERTAELDVSLLSVEEFNSLGLGDLVTVYLDATNTFETMRIVGFSEVCKEGETTRSITLGTKRLTNNVRAAKYAAL